MVNDSICLFFFVKKGQDGIEKSMIFPVISIFTLQTFLEQIFAKFLLLKHKVEREFTPTSIFF